MSTEEKWFRRLKRVLSDMPSTVEIQVHQNFIQMNHSGAREETFARRGHADEVESISTFGTKRVYPCSESI
ncbi:hypothetical protein ACCZ74_08650 [Agrobacterium vitis]|uniref:hypothetical protein n=1 Tax=Agrobacterium vitis TaxID=373 RepID=UPI00403E523B